MDKNQSSSYFWVSYTDLITSLFFIMLVLYVLTLSVLMVKQNGLIAKAEELERLKEIEKSVNEIDSSYFAYNQEFRKHVLKIEVSFPSRSKDIYAQNNRKTRNELVDAGKEILELVEKFRLEEEDIKYLVIIEGQASADKYPYNYELSYERALSLYKFWKEQGVDMEDEENIELIIAGSGAGGVPRESPNWSKKNQRFLIHIIPKVRTATPN